jgi:hypothetical protein
LYKFSTFAIGLSDAPSYDHYAYNVADVKPKWGGYHGGSADGAVVGCGIMLDSENNWTIFFTGSGNCSQFRGDSDKILGGFKYYFMKY